MPPFFFAKSLFTNEFHIVRFQQQFRLKGARGILDTRPYLSMIKAMYTFNVPFIVTVWPLLFPLIRDKRTGSNI